MRALRNAIILKLRGVGYLWLGQELHRGAPAGRTAARDVGSCIDLECAPQIQTAPLETKFPEM